MVRSGLPIFVLLSALLACHGPQIDLGGNTCESSADCAPGEVCAQDFFGGLSCSRALSNYGGSGAVDGGSFGAGGTPGSGASPGSGVTCGGEPCVTPPDLGPTAEPCCATGDLCGSVVYWLFPACVALDQPGELDPSCPTVSVAGELLAGCCTETGRCGLVRPGFGCVDPSEIGGPPGPTCPITFDAGDAGDPDVPTDGGAVAPADAGAD